MASKRKRKRARNPSAPVTETRTTATEADGEDARVESNETGIPEVAPTSDLDKVHQEAIDRYDDAWEKDRLNQDEAYDDLKFLADDNAQWDAIALQQRVSERRPVLTVNKCPQFIRQVTGDIRQLRPAIHVVPINEGSEALASDVLPEMVRYIERRSDAKGAYFHAADQMVSAGIGHVRVYTEYAGFGTFNQEIAIGPVVDGIAVVWDADASELTRRDANYCFVLFDFARKVAEQRWPDKSFDAPMAAPGAAFDGWASDDHIRVAEYWRKVPMERELAVYPTGQVIDLTDDDYDESTEPEQFAEPEAEPEDTPEDDKPSQDEAHYRPGEGEERCANCTMFRAPAHCTAIQDPVRADMLCDYFELKPEATLADMAGGDLYGNPQRPQLGPGMGPKRADAIAAGATIEKRDSYRVERIIMSATEILEGPEQWPGMHIPIVPFIGEQVTIGRRVVRRGIVRVLKDVQRLYNYAISADAEAVALQPKAPFKGTRKNFENFLDQWETANTRNWPFLEYDPDPENGGRPPEREPPPVASTGIRELLNTATGDMSAVTGIYPAALGATSNETSGKAITARQREGDTGTFHYIEAFARGVERVGQIVVDLMPHVYDTERTLRVVGDDGKATKIEINKPIIDPNGDGIDTITLNDVTIGSYQVAVEMGPSYSTKREEARDGMQTLMQSLGQQVAPLFADLYVRGQDFPLADKIAKRLQFLLPPQIAQAEAAQSGEPPPPAPPPAPPNPEVALKQGELQLKQQEVQGKIALQGQQLQLDQKKLQVELAKVDAELQKAFMAQQTSMAQTRADIVDKHIDRAHEIGMATVQHGRNTGEADVQRGHEIGMAMAQRDHEAGMAEIAASRAANGNGNGAALAEPEVADDMQQQREIDGLKRAVEDLQQAMLHLVNMLGGGGASSAPGGSPPGGPVMGPPSPGPAPPPPMAPFIGEPQPPPPGAAPAGAPPAI